MIKTETWAHIELNKDQMVFLDLIKLDGVNQKI